MALNYKHVVKFFYLKSVLLLSLFFAAGSCLGQSLPNIAGLVLWLSADSGVVTTGDSVSIWHDLSGGGNDAVATPGNQPKLINAPILNNKPSLLFNGTSDFFTGQQIAALDNNAGGCGVYLFVVCKANGSSSGTHGGVFTIGDVNTGLWLERHSGLGELYLNNNGANACCAYLTCTGMTKTGTFPYKIFEVRKTEGQSTSLNVNTTSLTSTSVLSGQNASIVNGGFTNAPYNIGLSPGYLGGDGYFNGEIAEIIAFNTCLTGPQIQLVETYLENKYSPPLNIGPRDTIIAHSLCAIPLRAAAGFNSYLWSTGATTASISATRSGIYSVIATDTFRGKHFDTITITFPSITLDHKVTICQGSSVELVPHISSFANYTFHWHSGQTTDSISVSAAGTYWVTVTDAIAHCSVSTDTETVVVDAFRSTVSLGPAASHCAENRISLVTPTTGWSNLLFHWSNGSTDSLLMLGPASGAYSVTVTDTNGCSGSASVNVTITGVAPHVNFENDTVCLGVEFTPNNLSDSVHVTYLWNFGDGTGTSTARFPAHNYLFAGTYRVHLTVSDTLSGCRNDTIIPVVVNALPAAAFQNGIVCTSDPTFTFMDLSVPASGQSIASWNWQFGDTLGNPLFDTSTVENPVHTFMAVAGTYIINLTITQANGCSANTSNTFIVELPTIAPSPPVLEFPVNGSVSATGSITFGWQWAPGAVYYKLVISTDQTLLSGDSTYLNIYTNQKTVTLPANQTYYWQVTAYNPCGDIAYSAIDTVTVFDPSDFSNLSLWLEADSGVVATGGAVSLWNDVSVNHNNAKATGAAEPTLLPQVPLLNHKPSLKFNGTNSVMSSINSTNNIGANSLSIFIVARADGALAGEPAGIFTMGQLYNGLWIERQPASGFEVINSYTGGAPNAIMSDATIMPNAACPYHVYGIMKNINTSMYLDSNGVFDMLKANSLIGAPIIDTAYILGHMAGTDPYSTPPGVTYGYMNGEIAEIIIYNTFLSPAQQQQVNNYLFNKYAPPVNLGPDIVQNYRLCPVTLRTGSRFVSYLWSTGQTSDTINVTQSGNYWVRTIDVFNHTSSDTINVTLPYHGSNPDTAFICHGDSGQIIQLINQPTSYTYQWYDSVSPSTILTLHVNSDSITASTGGYYYTRITDNGGCSFITKKIPVIIDNFYNANLLPDFDTICKFGTLSINPVSYTIDSFLWQPIADTVSAPTISVSGNYYLSTIDNHGCKNYDSTQLTTRAQAPAVNFTVPNYCLTNTTYFIDSSFAAPGDSIAGYYWNYGGGIPATDTTINGQTSYRLNYGYGNYTVSLKVTTDSGCYAIKTRHITILPSPNVGDALSANNSVYPYILCAGAGSSLQLTDTSTAIGGSDIVQRFWRFDNVVDADTGANIQYTFPNQGTYNITLEVVNSLGCADSITQQIVVYAPFVAQFSYTGHCLGTPTVFTDITPSLSIINRVWKFRENGDGPYAYTPTAQIQFNAPNTYDVELQLQNAIGCISTRDTLVKIVENPVADFTGLIGCQNHYYTPLDSSFTVNDILVNWKWNIDGNQLSVHYPSVLLTDTGAFNVSLKVTSQEGCVDSITKLIEVGPVPTASFAFTPLYGTAPLPVVFTNRSLHGTSYTWDFGDGTSTTTAVPQINPAPHTYTQNGNYQVVLYAYNDYGCYDSFARTLNIIPTNLDLAVELVTHNIVVQPDGSELVTVMAYLSNLGTRIITSAQLYATFGSRTVLEQNWSGILLSGQSILDTFPAQFVAPLGYTNTYVCVTATDVNGGETEINYYNNQECTSLTGTMQLAGPSPNPASTECQLGIILPQAGTVYISVYDVLGQPVIREFSMDLPAQRTNYNIPVVQLQGAEYFIRVRYNDDTQIRNFVVR